MQLQLVSTVVLVHCQGRFLLVQRAFDDDIFPGKWQSPGGKVELGETIEEAAARELKEETGLALSEGLQFVMSYAWHKSPTDPMRLGIILLTELPRYAEDIEITLDKELAAYGWFTLEEAADLDTIGSDVATGTYGQLKKAQTLLGAS